MLFKEQLSTLHGGSVVIQCGLQGIIQLVFGGYSVDIQWLFDSYSVVIQWIIQLSFNNRITGAAE